MPANQYLTTPAAVAALYAAGVRTTIVQRGDSSGDQSHVIPVLAVHANHGVLVIDAMVGGATTNPKGLNMANSYVDHFRIPVGRVAYVNSAAAMNAAIAGQLPHAMQKMSLTTTTTRTVNAIIASKANRTAIKAQFRGQKMVGAVPAVALPVMSPTVLLDIQLDQYRQARGIPLNQPVVVLWGRKSGKRGGPYPEMDHSTTGMAQIARRCSALNYTVLIAGDIPAAKIGPAPAHNFGNAIWLGDFWNHWGLGGDRSHQIRFFYVLSKMLKLQVPRLNLVHVGMRSGGLDMYGFSGQRIIYIVAPVTAAGGVNDNRMLGAFQALDAARIAGIVTSYSYGRYQATRIPKRYGHGARYRGFSPANLNTLVAQITASLA
ncbi:MAG: hypothetical protein HOP28_16410 [Gemmatimonadales bacterium]|nr:hypothetical protein [Gemmatimonadales bacterium]